MRRLHRLKAKEISLTAAGANRRIFATLKSQAKGGVMPAELDQATMRQQLQDVDPAVFARVDEYIAKAAEAGGKAYSAKAASVLKAIGRLMAPHSDELKASDIMAACKAAGMDVADPKSIGKAASSAKDAEDEDEEEEIEAEDEASTPENDDVADDEDEADEGEDEDEEDDHKPGVKQKQPAKKSANVALPGPIGEHPTEATPNADEALARNLTKPEGTSVAKSEKVPADEAVSLTEMRKHNKDLANQVEALRKHIHDQEALAKAEREQRELEDLKKSCQQSYGHMGVNVDGLALALRTLRGQESMDQHDAVVEALQKHETYRKSAEAMGGMFRSAGYAGSARSDNTPEGALDKLTKESMAKSQFAGKTYHQVYRAIAQTPEGIALMNQAHSDARGV